MPENKRSERGQEAAYSRRYSWNFLCQNEKFLFAIVLSHYTKNRYKEIFSTRVLQGQSFFYWRRKVCSAKSSKEKGHSSRILCVWLIKQVFPFSINSTRTNLREILWSFRYITHKGYIKITGIFKVVYRSAA